MHVFDSYLMKKKNFPWPSIPNRVGSYEFTSSKHAANEYEALKAFHFGEMCYQKHDPKGIVVNQVQNIVLL